MRTGVSYMGHHNPKYLNLDLGEMKELQLDDVLLAAQENDFVYFPGKLEFTPKIAAEYGLRPMAIFWGELDFVFDRTFLAEWKRRFPNAEVHSYPDAGHYILEDMKDEVVPLIEDFLARSERGAV